jgi:hypothetical protein
MPLRFKIAIPLTMALLCTLSALRAEESTWLAPIFPNTDKPGRSHNRLQRLDAKEIEINGQKGAVVTVAITYPELNGKEETAQARIFLPPSVKTDPTKRVPLIHNAGYEIDERGASGWLRKGYAVSTPHAHPLNPLGRGSNLDRAILHAARALSCIDPLRVSIQGGSAGGWMTLMLTADSFPLVWSMPDVPPIHWGYNAAYIDEQQGIAAPLPGSDKPRLLGVKAVGGIAVQSKATYGMPFDSQTYLATSPLDHLDTLTAPTLLVFSTADILVPIDQVSPKLIQPRDASRFPKEYTTAMTERFPAVKGKRTLLEALPQNRYELFHFPIPPNTARLPLAGTPTGAALPVPLPFSQKRTLSVVILDEGGVEPEVGHLKYYLGTDHENFRKWAEGEGVKAEQLTTPKLERLMKRLIGEPWRPFKIRPNGQGEEITATQLDYPEAERTDVLIGLIAFATSDACATQLGKLYAKLPKHLKALGNRLGNGTPKEVRKALEEHRDAH